MSRHHAPSAGDGKRPAFVSLASSHEPNHHSRPAALILSVAPTDTPQSPEQMIDASSEPHPIPEEPVAGLRWAKLVLTGITGLAAAMFTLFLGFVISALFDDEPANLALAPFGVLPGALVVAVMVAVARARFRRPVTAALAVAAAVLLGILLAFLLVAVAFGISYQGEGESVALVVAAAASS